MLIFSMSVSVDGYITDRRGGFEWTAPDDEQFRFRTEQVGELGRREVAKLGLASERDILGEIQIPVIDAGTAERIDRSIAEIPLGGRRGRG